MNSSTRFIPESLNRVAALLNSKLPHAAIYLVGGAVRNMLLERTTKDYDLVVCGIAADELEKTLGKLGSVNLVGKHFGVFKWVPEGWEGEAIDVALPRTEHVALGTGQYRDFTVQADANLPIEEDLKRRDFTVNALAFNLATSELVDPTGGGADLGNKILRAVGKPQERFAEDLSRVLRGLRFACQLGFTLEQVTWAAMTEITERTAIGTHEHEFLVPREIVAREFLKALIASPSQAITFYEQAGLLHHLLPEVTAMQGCPQPPEFHTEGDVYGHTLLALTMLNSPRWKEYFGTTKPSLNVLLATLLHDIGKPLTVKTPEQHGTDRIRSDGHDVAGAELVLKICERLKLSSYVDPEAGQVEPEVVKWAVHHHLLVVHGKPSILKPSTIYRYFWKDVERGKTLLGLIFADSAATQTIDKRDLTVSVRELQTRMAEVSSKFTQGKFVPLLTGDDIMAELKLTPGPTVGQLIKLLEEAQLEGIVTTREQALTYLKQHQT